MALPKLSQLRPREQLMALGCGAVLLVVALDRLVLAPWIRHAHTIHHEIHRMQEALQQHQRLLTRKTQVMAEYKAYQHYLRPPVADDLQTAALLKELEELALRSDVTLTEVKPLGVESNEAIKRYTFELRFATRLDAWIDLVHRIESSPSMYEVVRATLVPSEDDPERLDGVLRVMSAVVSAGPGQAGDADANAAKAARAAGGVYVASAK